MNIIVPSSGEVRFTQYVPETPYDINTINFYLQKEPLITDALTLMNKDENGFTWTYKVSLKKLEEVIVSNYDIYVIDTEQSIPQRDYECSLSFQDNSTASFNVIISNQYYTDQHAPVYIKNKTLDFSTSNIILVAEDSESECIIFRIEKSYDGISVLDPLKHVYVDYLPADYSLTVDEVNFFSDKIISRIESFVDGKSYVDLKWIIPYNAVRAAGDLKLAITIIGSSNQFDAAGNQIPYIWQTLPSSLKVHPNLAFRNSINITPEQGITLDAINDQLQNIQAFIDNIDNISYINQEAGEIVYTIREDGVESNETLSLTELVANGVDSNDSILFGGTALEEV